MENSFLGIRISGSKAMALRHNVGEIPLYISYHELDGFPDKKTIPHWSKGLETIYVQSGEMEVTADGRKLTLGANDICIIDAGCVHFLESIGGENCEFYCGVMAEELFSHTEAVLRRYIDPVFHAAHPNVAVVAAEDSYNEPIRRLFREVVALIEDKPKAYDLRIIAKYHEYLALLCEALENTFFMVAKTGSRSETAMKKMLTFIEEDDARAIHIEDLCASGEVSRSQCFQIFRKYTGDTPADFIRKHRLNKARQLLARREIPISQIALRCGFTHQSHLTNQFGVTPLQYRKLLTAGDGARRS